MNRILATCAACLFLFPLSADGKPANYVVTMTDPEAAYLSVDASFDLGSDTIGMFITRSPQLPNGQADLIRNLEITRDKQSLEFEDLGQGDWKIEGAEAGQRLSVRYDILLDHDQYDWGPGIDEVGYRTADGLFFTGRSLFMVPGFEIPDGAEIRFDLPESWQASTPWPNRGDTFIAKTGNDLIRNCLFLGTHRTHVVDLDGFRFTMVMGGNLWDQRQLFVDAMEPILPAAKATFGGMPDQNQYLVVFNQKNDQVDGGAFAASYSMLLKGKINEASSVVWGHLVAHELIHFWNGHTFAPVNQDEEWLKEGFTDYLTILYRSRVGLDSPPLVYRKIENCLRRYLVSKRLLQSPSTLQEAGHDKHKQRFLVYGGGTLIGIALDVRIRQATQNEKNLDDFLRAIFNEFRGNDRGYVLDDVIRIASQVAGEDQTKFFRDHVAGNEFLDLIPYLESIGLQVDTALDEFYISVSAEATPDQTAMRVAMLGH